MNRKALAAGQVLVASLIVLAGYGGAQRLVATAPKLGRAKPEAELVQVAYRVARRADHELEVRAHGEVRAAREVTLRPQVTGEVEWVSDQLVPGAVLPAGEVLFRIDTSDTELVLARARAGLEQARRALEIEEGRAKVARAEWDILQKDDDVVPATRENPLALRLPQLMTARAAVRTAQANVADAELDLKRAEIRAPFPAFVREKTTEVGALVGPQSDLVTLVGTEAFWIDLPLSPALLSRVRVPGVHAAQGSAARVVAEVGGERVERRGRVLRLLGSLDAEVRMARLLVEVLDPFDLRGEHPGEFPLLLGSYVDVALEAEPIAGAVKIPRSALQERERVYLVTPAGTLETREVEVVWRDDDWAWIGAGLEEGERYVVSTLASPIDGMPLAAHEAGATE